VDRVFLDTNVFLLAVGKDSPQRQACLDVLDAASRGDLEAVTSSEVLQEILHVRARRGSLDEALQLASEASQLVAETLPVRGDDVLSACTTLAKHAKIDVRDAIHVAVMKAGRIHTIISTDTDFDAIREIRRIDPKDAV
jgi:uncharacterized protein